MRKNKILILRYIDINSEAKILKNEWRNSAKFDHEQSFPICNKWAQIRLVKEVKVAKESWLTRTVFSRGLLSLRVG